MSNGGIAYGSDPDFTMISGGQSFQHGDDLKLPVRFSLNDEVTTSNSAVTTPPSESLDESAPSSGAAGTAPDEVYAKILAPWRAAIRRAVIWNLHNESKVLAKMQEKIRTPFWDKYFVYTSSLGTHTFFMIALPMLFFFGFPDTGRGLVLVLGMGVYASSFMKDLICAPRPYSPPVTRLTVGSHHLEYGFPSTHSTNSVSIALWAFSLVRSRYLDSAISTFSYSLACLFTGVYIVSIVFGRLYAGMHSFTDCVAGVTLGTAIWAVQSIYSPVLENWIISGPSSGSVWYNWLVPIVITVVSGVMVHRHPQPAEDCPCFEDAIAFVSVVAGVQLAQWGAVYAGFPDDRLMSVMPGQPFALFSQDQTFAQAWRSSSIWWGMALLKLTLGILLIFVWRIVAKYLLHIILPAFFRMLAYKVLPKLEYINILPKGSELPNRRFYTPATEYDGAVPEDGLHPIPSVIDLPSTVHEKGGVYNRDSELGGMKRRKGREVKHDGRRRYEKSETPGDEKDEYLAPIGVQNGSIYGGAFEYSDSDAASDEVVKHYDADVLTKVVVYAGIGIIASTLIPIMFEVLGWGVRVS